MTCAATRHGTATAYQVDGCRCPDAKEAQRIYRKRLSHDHHTGRARKVDATGTRRRWRALMALGWTNHGLMNRLGYAACGNWIAYADSIHVDTARKVKDLYDELWDQPGPSQWTRTWAANRGFLPPMAWDDDTIDDASSNATLVFDVIAGGSPCQSFIDEIALERFIAGDLHWSKLTRKERIAVALRMDDLGYSRNVIADRTRLNSRTLWDAFKAREARTASDSEETIAS